MFNTMNPIIIIKNYNDYGDTAMELKQLKYFIAVCEELHFTKAAEKLGIAQSTLSLQIGSLEEEIGLPLFDRVGKHVKYKNMTHPKNYLSRSRMTQNH